MWDEARITFIYLNNRLPHSLLENVIPEDKCIGRKLSAKHLKCFGYLAFLHFHKEQRNKLKYRARKWVMIGYAVASKATEYGYQKIIVESKQVTFDESKLGIKETKRQRINKSSNTFFLKTTLKTKTVIQQQKKLLMI